MLDLDWSLTISLPGLPVFTCICLKQLWGRLDGERRGRGGVEEEEEELGDTGEGSGRGRHAQVGRVPPLAP